ncbi:diguanylate cyclase (GGDEF)-like protein [Anaerospora hongkongensis]|uniref:Diguanylate cyclase (GGDEF)-like protein n=1 Tax=Anaerospora hongkongensis TaxID=244830 RepID=A0A4R1Q6C8_9FIRM|nr:GGDEF domain-containing protein [Anaerospora hongkongensis]TCL36798.1 diguanylate cyclase (GGDEF)-like protein [Anaerospora hongkongensis]
MVAEQEGLFRYTKKRRGYLRPVLFLLVIASGAGMWFFNYIYPSLACRIIVFSLVSMIFSVIFINTLFKSDEISEAPIKLLATAHTLQFGVMGARAALAYWQGGYVNSYLHLGGMQAVLVLALSACHISRAVGYFWLIVHRLGLEIQKQAVTDELTGLYNRRAFGEYLEQLTAEGTGGFGIAMIDVDKFKSINDQHGHLAGDRYLIQISNLFRTQLGVHSRIFRYGGDEFIAIIPNVTKAELLQMLERVRCAAADLKIPWEEKTVQSTLSIGISLAAADGNSLDQLLAAADKALYVVKEQGGNQIAIL